MAWLGVALAFSVHLINEIGARRVQRRGAPVNGQPDFELARAEGFDEALFAHVATQPGVALASAVIELDAQALDAAGQPVPLRVIGLDALAAARSRRRCCRGPPKACRSPRRDRPGAAFLNAAGAAARRARHAAAARGARQHQFRGARQRAGRRPAAGGARPRRAQQAFGWMGRISRIDVRLVPGADREALLRTLQLSAGVRRGAGRIGAARLNVSRAHRVNLTVLALVALFTGAFLVFSILSLSVARRAPQLALLGVLGLSARGRLAWMLAESALIGLAGSVLGLALGTGLAALALRLLAGDLGGAYFPGVAPRLQFSATAALVTARSAWPSRWRAVGCQRSAQRIAPAQTLKGLGEDPAAQPGIGWALLLALGVRWRRRRRWPASRWPLTPRWPARLAASPAMPAAVALLLRRARASRLACAAGRQRARQAWQRQPWRVGRGGAWRSRWR